MKKKKKTIYPKEIIGSGDIANIKINWLSLIQKAGVIEKRLIYNGLSPMSI